MPTQLEREHQVLSVLAKYLLLERKQESQLSIAFSVLVQERHNEFHTKQRDRQTGDGSDFSECSNDFCKEAFNLLKDSRSMAIEINDVSLQMIKDFDLQVRNEGRTCRAFLTPRQQVQESKIIEEA